MWCCHSAFSVMFSGKGWVARKWKWHPLLLSPPKKKNKYERYYLPGKRSLAYLLYYMYILNGKPRLCINIHHYAPQLAPPHSVLQAAPRIELQSHWLQQAAVVLGKVQWEVLNR